MPKPILFLFSLPFLLLSCMAQKKHKADLIITGATIYPCKDSLSTADAIAIQNGKVLAIGSTDTILSYFTSDSILHLPGYYIIPGIIDAHCHFLGYGLQAFEANLTGLTSWKQILDTLVAFAKKHPEGWIIGRGWDQSLWDPPVMPNKHDLDSLFPNRPVYLVRVDGHAAICNSKALQIANIQNPLNQPEGGLIVIDKGKPTGLLIDKAMELIEKVLPPPSPTKKKEAFLHAQKQLFAFGITTICDAWLPHEDLNIIQSLQQTGELKLRIYGMLPLDSTHLKWAKRNGAIMNSKLHICSFKAYADGALGSRGALLKNPYSDHPSHKGLLLLDLQEYQQMAHQVAQLGFQLNTHAIGDQANALVLSIYQTVPQVQSLRWRIEHAQVVDPQDIPLFKLLQIIPSVQPCHLNSDLRWVTSRLGTHRIPSAYPYRSLLQARGLLAVGTDFPVESPDPSVNMWCGTTRKSINNQPPKGLAPEQKLTPWQILLGMTKWAAYSARWENEIGTLTPGHFADFVILKNDPLKIENQWEPWQIVATYLEGECVYQNDH